MFALRSVDLAGRVLGCADGPASFNAELTARGGRVVSTDPLYQFTADEIRSRITDARDRVVANTSQNMDAYRWDAIPSLDALCDVRMQAMECFLDDYTSAATDGRYRNAQLPDLPFDDHAFDLVLCSHFLFLYSSMLSLDFHVIAIQEMLRVGREARVFPLVDFNGRPSEWVAPVCDRLASLDLGTMVVRVPYEFQRGANEMLVVRR
jgi:hypothetical protein